MIARSKQLELARIGTIHAFCGDLLHERPVEAGIDPLFEVASEEEAEALADEAFDRWFQTYSRRSAGGRSPHAQASIGLARHRANSCAPQCRASASIAIFQSRGAAIRSIGRRDRHAHGRAGPSSGALAAASSWPEDHLARNLAEIARFVEETTRLEAVRGRDYDGTASDEKRAIEAVLKRLIHEEQIPAAAITILTGCSELKSMWKEGATGPASSAFSWKPVTVSRTPSLARRSIRSRAWKLAS